MAIVIIAGLAYNHRVVLAELAAYRNQQAELADTLRELKTALASRPERWQGRASPHNQSERTSDERANPDSPDRPPAEGTRSQPSQTSGTSHKRTCGVCKKTCKSAEGLAAHNRAKHGTGGAASHATPQTPQLASGPNYAGLTSSHRNPNPNLCRASLAPSLIASDGPVTGPSLAVAYTRRDADTEAVMKSRPCPITAFQ